LLGRQKFHADGIFLPQDQVRRTIDGQDLSLFHDSNPAAQRLRLLQVMAGQYDCFSLSLDLTHQVPEVKPGYRIESGGRLIEEDDIGVIDEGGYNGEALLLAAGELADPHVATVLEIHHGEKLPRLSCRMVESAKEPEDLFEGEVFEVSGCLELNADSFLDAVYIFDAVQAEHPGRAGSRSPQALDDFQGGSLAGAVFSEKPEYISLEDLEADSLQDLAPSIDLYEIVYLDNGLLFQSSASSWVSANHRRLGTRVRIRKGGQSPAAHRRFYLFLLKFVPYHTTSRIWPPHA
jgi:hypothetical protein